MKHPPRDCCRWNNGTILVREFIGRVTLTPGPVAKPDYRKTAIKTIFT